MSALSTTPILPAPVQRDGLAAGSGGMVRSVVMKADPEAKLLRAKDRLYVLCQLMGWGGLLAMQLLLQNAVNSRPSPPLHDQAVVVMI
ncbi:MAG TPA: hypothetical protein VHN79_06125, partial [Lacunisphaera sp.]|nr:hypothetical protein [Lacunisphaera sp.]